MQVSFAGRIPIVQTQIKNLITGEFEPAVVYEIDCSDESDILEAEKPREDWSYAHYIRDNMKDKFLYQNQPYGHNFDDTHFYILESKDGETLGMSEVEELFEGVYDLSYLDTKEEKPYKFVGQSILAAIVSEIKKKSAMEFNVYGAVSGAMNFYIEKCGFKRNNEQMPFLDSAGMSSFVEQTEDRVKAPMIDLTI